MSQGARITHLLYNLDLCIQHHSQDTFHLQCDNGLLDNSEDMTKNSLFHNILVLGILVKKQDKTKVWAA